MNSMIPRACGRPQNSLTHYVALLLPTEFGDWRVLFPDIADCEARGFTVQDATYAAATALARCAGTSGVPLPRSLAQINDDRRWFSVNGIALNDVVVTMVPLTFASDSLQF